MILPFHFIHLFIFYLTQMYLCKCKEVREEVSYWLDKLQSVFINKCKTSSKIMTLLYRTLNNFYFPNKGGNFEQLWFMYYLCCVHTFLITINPR